MRESVSTEVLAGAPGWACTVSAWSPVGDLLAASVPVAGGSLTWDSTQKVPERATIDVPRFALLDGQAFDWNPSTDTTHPLARYGQQLTISVTVTDPLTGDEVETPLARLVIQSWSDDDSGLVQVEAVGLIQQAADARFTVPTAPQDDGTLASEFARLLPGAMASDVSGLLEDRPCPSSMEWTEERIDALYEIADAWPATLTTDAYGQVVLMPPPPEVLTPVHVLTDGERGTLVSAPRDDTRDGAYNVVVARSSSPDVEEEAGIQGIARREYGPMATSTYGEVVGFYASPLLTTVSQALRAAQTRLASSLRPSRVVSVACVPDPRIECYDPIAVTRDGVTEIGLVIAVDMPLLGDELMRVDVSLA